MFLFLLFALPIIAAGDDQPNSPLAQSSFSPIKYEQGLNFAMLSGSGYSRMMKIQGIAKDNKKIKKTVSTVKNIDPSDKNFLDDNIMLPVE